MSRFVRIVRGIAVPRPKSRGALVLLLLLLFMLPACTGGHPGSSRERGIRNPTVLLVSFDGFRWDYLDLYDAPTMASLANAGVRAERLIPVFPSKTFPSHYSAVTGLYPENHGIVSNTIYDPDLDARFSLSDREAVSDERWWGGEPIWVTAEMQGRTAATYFWPGSEAPIQDVRPSYWYAFDADVPGEQRVDQVLAWLDLPTDQRPSIITLYFGEVDRAGHRYGPRSDEVAEAVARVDTYLDRLVTGLEERAILDDVDLLVISDHGMAETSPDRVVILDEYFNPEEAHIVDYSPVLMMYPPESDGDRTVAALKKNPHLSVYLKERLPERFHLDHPRTPPVVAIAESGWVIASRSSFERNPNRYAGGAHGYDNLDPDMGGLFVARGPSFRQGVVTPPFEIVHLYPLLCEILGLDPAPNDGDLDAVADLLHEPAETL